MPAARPRMQVTPSETVYRLLKELSDITGDPPATLVRQLLDEAVPALELAIEAIRDVKRRPEHVQAAMARFADTAIRDLSQARLDLDSALNQRPGRKPQAANKGKGAANTG
jgi:predicted DNA-binding protein